MREKDHGNPVLMLIEKNSHCLSFYDAAAGILLESIELPDYPHEFAVDSKRAYAYVGHYGVRTSASTDPGGSSVFVIDIAQRKLARTIDCRPFSRLHGIMLDGSDRLHVLSEAANVMLRFDDPISATAPSRAVITGGLKSHLFTLSHDGQWAYCMNLLSHTVTKISPGDATVVPVPLSPGIKPEGQFLSANGQTLYVSNRASATLVAINTQTMKVIRETPTRHDPARIYGMRDSRLFIANYDDRSISVVDPLSLEETGYLKLYGRPAAACLHPDTGHAYVSIDTDECAEIDPDNLNVIRSFRTKSEPDCCFIVT
ncbi:YncE family protein [Phyllobacterium sp. 628]|uniref:YncE family protein n=1 Tax=Phyllobacterium sp. 628 TaxID=2718938 RepID=UPI0016625768|nr:YncE family protein [Phyllobacterium sp. 628]QND50783.1 YncE family protein [Phyllobacterium sp. 628]